MFVEENIKLSLLELFYQYSGVKAENISVLPESGSNRKYFLISSMSIKAIGAFNPDRKENIAFISFSKLFKKHNLNVPLILAENWKTTFTLLNI